MRSNIVLIGMPGAGKSTVGVVMAKILGMDFLDADLLIQHKHECTLQEIIDNQGTQKFIEIENEVLSEIDVEHCVVSTGGSAVYSAVGMQHLASLGRIVYLRVSFDEMKQRLGDLDERGIVFKQDSDQARNLFALYQERTPLYEEYAEVTVDVDSLTITGVVQKVIQDLEASF